MANKRSVVHFGGLPAVSFKCPIPNAQGEAIQYSNLSVGSDDALASGKVEVEVEHDEAMPHYQVAVLAYRLLLKAVAEGTWREFQACRQRIMDEARDISL